MDPARETAKEIRGEPASVSNVLSGSGAGGITLWGGELRFFGSNLLESGRSACGIPQTDDGA